MTKALLYDRLADIRLLLAKAAGPPDQRASDISELVQAAEQRVTELCTDIDCTPPFEPVEQATTTFLDTPPVAGKLPGCGSHRDPNA